MLLASKTSPGGQFVLELPPPPPPPPSARAGPLAIRQTPRAAAEIIAIRMITPWLSHGSRAIRGPIFCLAGTEINYRLSAGFVEQDSWLRIAPLLVYIPLRCHI